MREIEMYTDGSFNAEKKKYGSGIVFAPNTEFEEKIYFGGTNPVLAKSYQIPGELEAVVVGIKKVQELNKELNSKGEAPITKIKIYHDYAGVADYPTGKQRPGKELTKNYKAFMLEVSKEFEIEYIHVESHTGNEYNEMADELSKKGCDIG